MRHLIIRNNSAELRTVVETYRDQLIDESDDRKDKILDIAKALEVQIIDIRKYPNLFFGSGVANVITQIWLPDGTYYKEEGITGYPAKIIDGVFVLDP